MHVSQPGGTLTALRVVQADGPRAQQAAALAGLRLVAAPRALPAGIAEKRCSKAPQLMECACFDYAKYRQSRWHKCVAVSKHVQARSVILRWQNTLRSLVQGS